MINFGSSFVTNRSGIRQTRFAGGLNEKKERAVSSSANQAHRLLRRQNAFVVLDGEVFPKDSGLRFEDLYSKKPEIREGNKEAVHAEKDHSSVDAVWGRSQSWAPRQIAVSASFARAAEKENEQPSRLEMDTDSDAGSMTATEVDSASDDEISSRTSQSAVYSWKDRQREVWDITQQALRKLRARRSQGEAKTDVSHKTASAQQQDSKKS